MTRETSSLSGRSVTHPSLSPSICHSFSDLSSLNRWCQCTPCLSWIQLVWWGASSKPQRRNAGRGAIGSNLSLSKANMTFHWPAAGIRLAAGSHACRRAFISANLTVWAQKKPDITPSPHPNHFYYRNAKRAFWPAGQILCSKFKKLVLMCPLLNRSHKVWGMW